MTPGLWFDMEGALLLLADSQLLFRQDKAPELHCRMKERFPNGIEVAYLGASNDHDPEFYELACAGICALIGQECVVHPVCSERDLPQPCPVVVLAGGSVAKGWEMLRRAPVQTWLQRCRGLEGSVIIGVSAGAMHLASGFDPEQPQHGLQTFLNWFPHPVAVHEEESGWPSLQGPAGIGIPMGAGLWVEGNEKTQWQKLGCTEFKVIGWPF